MFEALLSFIIGIMSSLAADGLSGDASLEGNFQDVFKKVEKDFVKKFPNYKTLIKSGESFLAWEVNAELLTAWIFQEHMSLKKRPTLKQSNFNGTEATDEEVEFIFQCINSEIQKNEVIRGYLDFIYQQNIHRNVNKIVNDQARQEIIITDVSRKLDKIINSSNKEYRIELTQRKTTLYKPTLLKDICKRSSFIQPIVKELSIKGHVHIYGGAWSGKTQILNLISQGYKNNIWISLSKGGDPKIAENELLDLLSNNSKRDNIDNICNEFCASLSSNTLVILDDIPKLIRTQGFLDCFISLINACMKHNVKLLTSSYTDTTSVLRNYINTKYFTTYKITKMTYEDVTEILISKGAPKSVLASRTNEILSDLYGEMPAIIISLCDHFSHNAWDINSLLELFSRSTGELESEIQDVLMTTIEDSTLRDLLYRISYIGHPISIQVIEEISKIEPRINMIGEKLSQLKNKWVYCNDDGDYYVSNVLFKIAESNLNKKTKKSLSKTVANLIIEKYYLNQFDVTQVIIHLLNAEEYEEVAILYIKVIKSLIDEKLKDTSFISKLWLGTTLPSEFSIENKIIIRVLQMKYISMMGGDIHIIENEIIQLSREINNINIALYSVGYIALESPKTACSVLIEYQNQKEIPSDGFLEIYKERMPINIVNAIILMTSSHINTIEELEIWLRCVESLKLEQINELKNQVDINILVFEFFCRIYLNFHLNDEFKALLERTINWSIKNNWEFWLACALRQLIFHYAYKENNYDKAVAIYEKYKQSQQLLFEDGNYIIQRTIGRVSFDLKHFDKAKQYLIDEFKGIRLEDVFPEENITLLILSANLMANYDTKKAMEFAHEGLKLSKEFIDFDLSFCLKIYGEYIIIAYLCEELKENLSIINEVLELTRNNAFKDKEAFIGVLAHCTSYIVADIIFMTPPTVCADGSKYLRPATNMFINKKDNQAFINQQSNEMLYFIFMDFAFLSDYYHKPETSEKLFTTGYGLYLDSTKKDLLYSWNVASGYPSVKLLQLNRFTDCIRIWIETYMFVKADKNTHGLFQIFCLFITLLITNDILENKKNKLDAIELKYTDSLEKLMQSGYDTKLWKEYRKLVVKVLRKEIEPSELVQLGNAYKETEYSDLQIISYIFFSIDASPESLLRIQCMLLEILFIYFRGNGIFYEEILSKYFKSSWSKTQSVISNKLGGDHNNGEYKIKDYLDAKKFLKTLATVYPYSLDKELNDWLAKN